MRDLKATLIQSQQFWEDKAQNLKHFERHFEKHLKPGESDLVILPEMFNTGFTMHTTLAEKMDGESIAWLKKWATKLDTTIGASLIIEADGEFYNRFVFVSAKGVDAHYDKRHLFRMANEQEHFSPGKKRTIFNLKGWRILLQVCYDLRFPIFSRNRTMNGDKEYDLLIYIANWPEKRNYAWINLLQARAIENQAFCIGVNRVGVDGNDIAYSGDSMCIDPWGKVKEQFTASQEVVQTLTLNAAKISDITERFPAFMDADTHMADFKSIDLADE